MKFKQLFSMLCVLLMLLAAAMPFTASAATAQQMKDKLLSVAEGEVGYEGTSSYSKYGEWYGYQGGWCTTFALWCFHQAGDAYGVKLYANIVPSGGNCNSMISWFQNKGRYHTYASGYTPSKGDLIFFDWSGNGSSQHVGIVNYVSGDTVYTVEGNCSGKVKEKEYYPGGSYPYASTDAIMGYGSPDWSAVADGAAQAEQTTAATTAPPTTTAATTAATTTAPSTTQGTTQGQSSTQSTAAATTQTTETTTETTTESTTESTTVPLVQPTDMKLYAATNTLEIGDSVTLDYTVEPSNANAVVGYFCDEENIIEISEGGVITATGEGVATVVVCANDEIYRQCDFVVRATNAQVTRKTPVEASTQLLLPETITKTKAQLLSEIGINVDKLASHRPYYIVPLCIIGTTAVLAVSVYLVKKAAKRRKRK